MVSQLLSQILVCMDLDGSMYAHMHDVDMAGINMVDFLRNVCGVRRVCRASGLGFQLH